MRVLTTKLRVEIKNEMRVSQKSDVFSKQMLYRGLIDFEKSCVATHISEDMDRWTDCVGQCTICRSIPSDLYELHNFATEVLVSRNSKWGHL